MFAIVVPILSIILVGYLFGKRRGSSVAAEGLINDYVLYFALPSMVFLAVAEASPAELMHGSFLVAGLAGIIVAYVLGVLVAHRNGVSAPQSAIVGMGAGFGNTGYMGIPVMIAALGGQAAAPAALATILHNIPVILAVVVTFGLRSGGQDSGRGTLVQSMYRAVRTVLSSPITLSALVGLVFAVFEIPLPVFLKTFTRFLGAAAGPTALFALGLSFARLKVREHFSRRNLKLVLPVIGIKLIVQPAVTLLVAVYVFGMPTNDLWFIAAIVMAAQPVGAVVFLFANNYQVETSATSLAIVLSSLVSVITLPLLLGLLVP